MDALLLPMCKTQAEQDQLEFQLNLVPGRDYEDAVQEAWVAVLQGRNAATAVNTFKRREQRHRDREGAIGTYPEPDEKSKRHVTLGEMYNQSSNCD